MATKAPWKTPRPAGPKMTLDAAAKQRARERAKRAGRRYPNLVDNMWAARQQRKKST